MNELPKEATDQTDRGVRDLITAVSRVSAWHDSAIEYEKVTGGITNENFKVRADGATFFVKIPGSGTEAFIDRANCHVANQIAAEVGIGPAVAHFFPDTGVEIFDWLDGYRTMNWGDVYDNDVFLGTADLIRKFQTFEDLQMPLVQTAFEQTFEMIRMAREMGTYLPPEMDRMEYLAHQIEAAVERGGIEYRPCHNDYYSMNILIHERTGELKLVDYEYASMNDECYDMGVYSGANYFTEEMDVMFIKRRYGGWDEERFARLKLYKLLADIKWSMWALVQDRIATVRFDYFNWFGTKMARLRGNSLDPRIDYWLNLVGRTGRLNA
ncbi:MAG TPA: choline/ethanolamine kinase family protein [Pseudomonadales bacterium]|jgi:thiamine kinase-like enzyme